MLSALKQMLSKIHLYHGSCAMYFDRKDQGLVVIGATPTEDGVYWPSASSESADIVFEASQ